MSAKKVDSFLLKTGILFDTKVCTEEIDEGASKRYFCMQGLLLWNDCSQNTEDRFLEDLIEIHISIGTCYRKHFLYIYP